MIDRPLFAETVVWRHPCDCKSASRPLAPGEEPEHRFDVDGHPFPWHLLEDRPATFRKRGGVYTVAVRILPMLRRNTQIVSVKFIPPEGRPLIGGREFPWALTGPVVFTADHKYLPLLELTFLANHVDADVDIPEDSLEGRRQWTPAQDACLAAGGHFWNDAEPGDNYQCRRCNWGGARNWPSINEANA